MTETKHYQPHWSSIRNRRPEIKPLHPHVSTVKETQRSSFIRFEADRVPIQYRHAYFVLFGSESAAIKRVKEFVGIHFGEIRTVDELARVAGMSPSYFAHRFREEVGEPPWAFIRRIRAEEARKRLETGNTPAEVAFDTGYADQAHLTREMQARYGQTPGELRHPALNREEEPVEKSSSVQD